METARRLHDEHLEIETLMKRLHGLAHHQGLERPGEADRDAINSKLSEITAGIRTLLSDHLAFEEEHLFPRLAANGETDMGQLLTAEHELIRKVADSLTGIARAALDEGFTADSWRRFHRLAFELADRVISHAEKEEMALLPLVEELLSADDDMELAAAHIETRR